MRGSIKLVLVMAFAALAMSTIVPAADAPHLEFSYRAYITGIKKVFPAPIMGIRGHATVLALPIAG